MIRTLRHWHLVGRRWAQCSESCASCWMRLSFFYIASFYIVLNLVFHKQHGRRSAATVLRPCCFVFSGGTACPSSLPLYSVFIYVYLCLSVFICVSGCWWWIQPWLMLKAIRFNGTLLTAAFLFALSGWNSWSWPAAPVWLQSDSSLTPVQSQSVFKCLTFGL